MRGDLYHNQGYKRIIAGAFNKKVRYRDRKQIDLKAAQSPLDFKERERSQVQAVKGQVGWKVLE